jgi:hypothetical protein
VGSRRLSVSRLSGKSSDMGMVLEDGIEVMRGSTYEQVESEREDRGSKEKDRCPLTPPPRAPALVHLALLAVPLVQVGDASWL